MTVHVAVAVIVNAQDEVLISLRPTHVHQGGLWEFPGGKVERGETVFTALQRELYEELAVKVSQARPLIRIHHDYADKSVLLDVWLVQRFSGEAHGREGQSWRWVPRVGLNRYTFPAANVPIVQAVSLPDCYLITPADAATDTESFLDILQRSLASGINLVQLRVKQLRESDYVALAERVLLLCEQYGAKLLLNAAPSLVTAIGAHGVHLSTDRLMQCAQRPLAGNLLVGASCHNAQELAQAGDIGADFAVLGPVLRTASHPDAVPLGWHRFQSLADRATLPVYALGGMELSDREQAFNCGAQGIAAIRALWQAG